jgi:hypothetical protein
VGFVLPDVWIADETLYEPPLKYTVSPGIAEVKPFATVSQGAEMLLFAYVTESLPVVDTYRSFA